MNHPFQMNLVYLKSQDAICIMHEQNNSILTSKKASQCRNNGVTGKGDIVFEVVMNWMRYELLSTITSTNICLRIESESDKDVFYFWYGIFEVFEIL